VVAIALIASTVIIKSCLSANADIPPSKEKELLDKTKTPSTKSMKNTWQKDSSVNQMGEKTIFMNIEANDLVFFDFPYNGGSLAQISLRKKGSWDAMFVISKGQIDTDYDGTYIRVKFDDDAPVSWSMSETASGSREMLFFNNTSRFINKLKNSKKVVLEVPFYTEGKRQFVFNTEGLNLESN